MSSPAWTCQQIREVDRRAVEVYGMSSLVLMENAGRGTADVLCQQEIQGAVLICCGKGNNGGDGLVLARHLDLRGLAVTIACWNAPGTWRGDTAINAQIAAKADIPLRQYVAADESFVRAVQAADWIVDALLGTGSRGVPQAPLADVIRSLNSRNTARLLAIDLPSGLDADTGIPHDPTVRADITCTFVREKIGFRQAAAREFLGKVHVLDIGVPRKLLEEL